MKLKLSNFTILIIFGCFTLIGLSLIPLLSLQLKPSQQSSNLNISFSWPKASAKVIEEQATSKLEGVFNTVKGIRYVSSISSKGKGDISLEFKKHADMDAVRFEIANLIRQTYPNLSKDISYPQVSGSFQGDKEEAKSILLYSIHAHESSYYIKKYAEEKLVSYISEIKGIKEVVVKGATNYEWVIEYDINKLPQLNITASDIANGLRSYLKNTQIGFGVFENQGKGTKQEMSLSIVFNSDEEIKWSSIPIKRIDDRILYLTDVSKIRFKEADVNSFHRINGLNSVSIDVYADAGVNTIQLTEYVKKRIGEIQNKVKGDGYSLKLVKNTSEYLIKEIDKIKTRSMYSFLVLLLLIFFINRSFKYLLVLLLSIIVNLSIAVILYYFLDVELHMYSFAGLTISFGIIIDNSIIMIDHLRNKGNKKAFLAILAATLTTIGALMIIFFLKENQRINLLDFGLVIAINIGVSLLVSLFFVPAMLEQLKIQNKNIKFSWKSKKIIFNYTQLYIKLVLFLKKNPQKWSLVLFFILGFGLPLYLVPNYIKGEGIWANFYNKTLGNEWFVDEIKPNLSKYIGGSLRLFSEETFANSHNSESEKTELKVIAKMPPGCSIDQLNTVIMQMENIISKYDEIDLYETNIGNAKLAKISIFFKEEFELKGFPFVLKDILESKAISLGAADWSINGVGKGFSNALGTTYKSHSITLEGYNYNQLYDYAEGLKQQIEENSMSRAKNVEIKSGRWSSLSEGEFYLDLDEEKIEQAEISQSSVYGFFKNQMYSNNIASIVNDKELQSVKLESSNYNKVSVWDLKKTPLWISAKQIKLNTLATIEKRETGNQIKKENQKYSLDVVYDYIGTHQLAKNFKKNNEKIFSKKLSIGFNFKKGRSNNHWEKDDPNQYFSLFVVIVIIFFVCSVLLESLKQPFAIISMIPISFIGVFLTFYLFEFNFDQGGYASFILLSGISVNSALYIINDFNNLKIQYPRGDVYRLYFKAFNYKIIPIILTIVSTVVGLVPFVWNGQMEAFWFSFAVGSIGGLLFSLIGIIIYLPLFILKRKKNEKKFI